MSKKRVNRKKEIRRSQRLQARQKKTSKSSDEIYTVVDNDKTRITNQKLRSDIENTIKQLKFLKVQVVMSLKNNQILSNLEKQIIQDETKKIVDSIISAIDFLITGHQSILQNAISVRYILEALITTELLVKEEEYKFILNLAFYPAQIARLQAVVNELQEEIKRLEKWTKLSEEKYVHMLVEFDKSRDESVVRAYHEYEKSLAIEFDKQEFNIYSDIESFQYPLPFEIRAEQIRLHAIPEYEKRIKELQEKQDLIATDIRKEPIIQRLFPDINYQKTRVFKEIVDKKGTNNGARSWDKKAEDTGLGSEYRFMYSYTSNLSHFASYSIKTSNLISVDEERLLLKRLRVYLYKIVNNLKVFSQLDEVIASMDHEKFNVIELSPEN